MRSSAFKRHVAGQFVIRNGEAENMSWSTLLHFKVLLLGIQEERKGIT
jgi:hypothetical protein